MGKNNKSVGQHWAAARDDASEVISFKEGLFSPSGCHISALLFFGIFNGLYVASVYKQIALHDLDDGVLTIAGAIGSVCNGGSRIVWAALMDKVGFKKVYFALLCIQLVIS